MPKHEPGGWPAPPPLPPEACLVCGAEMPNGPESGNHSAPCNTLRKGAPGIGRPARSVREWGGRGGRGIQAFHPSVQQLVDTADRVQQVRTDDALVHPFTVDQLAIIAWALGVATVELVEPSETNETALRHLTVRIDARLEALERFVQTLAAARAKDHGGA